MESVLRPQLADLPASLIKPGMRVAITAGSRGITDLVAVLRELGCFVRSKGAVPFIVPSMGSHSGATAEGQLTLLRSLGITEESTSMAIESSMETKLVGKDPRGIPLYMDRKAWESDGVILVNRIKPHSGFDGPIESGLLKMAVIGLGKHDGAQAAHQAVLAYGYNHVIAAMGKIFLSSGKILFGIGLVENAFHQTARLEVVTNTYLLAKEEEMLEEAKQLMPRLPFDQCDLLLIDYIGKEISGVGLDPNVIGRRMFIAEPEPEKPRIKRIVIRDLTFKTDGNALGVGLADYITCRLYKKINWETTYINAVTSKTPEKARLPIVCESDRQALQWAADTAVGSDLSGLRFCWISDTQYLDEMVLSENLLNNVAAEHNFVSKERVSLDYDEQGNLPLIFRRHFI